MVLVATSHPGNIGGVARAMKNMGLSRLVLVEPNIFPSTRADSRASGALDVLKDAKVVATLEEALQGCTLVFGTSARERHLPWPIVEPRDAAKVSIENALAGAEIAIVFGRERTGLTNEELHLCQYHVTIPTNPDFSSLNLAAAVQVIAYELRLACRDMTPEVMQQAEQLDPQALATTEDMERFYQHLEETLIDIAFLDAQQPKHLMSRLRRLYGRQALEKIEMNILRGILTKTQKAARGELKKRGEEENV
ncbi:tRNA (cytosine(32)/uridine(32)-2'-O)-methyltransferase TrmJ [Pseudomonas sp. F1_0610]|uniref:tRNA (cytosine(32)/uridine(32)-2'-O)-methyltransferase TrmJ n=1 Tax=Pseudomonas sp. F1_0610 TaxID=3114284 RepID=UPI0039C46472